MLTRDATIHSDGRAYYVPADTTERNLELLPCRVSEGILKELEKATRAVLHVPDQVFGKGREAVYTIDMSTNVGASERHWGARNGYWGGHGPAFSRVIDLVNRALDEASGEKLVPPIDERAEGEIMAAIRIVALSRGRVEWEELKKDVKQMLGYGHVRGRSGTRIMGRIWTGILQALKRNIIKIHPYDDYTYLIRTPTLYHYDKDFLVEKLLTRMRKDTWYEKKLVLDDLASWLGFPGIDGEAREPIEAAYRSAMRRGDIERDGDKIKRIH